MSANKIVFCFVLIIGFVYAEDVSSRSIQRTFLPEPVVTPKQTRAFVIDTNLSSNDANIIANDVQQVYNSISGALNRAIAIQNKLGQRFPSVKSHVIINYSAIAYYQKYYVIVSVNGDTVLCFGL